MPMLKTVGTGTTSIAGVQAYLEKPRRQEHGSHLDELELFEEGGILLPGSQIGRLEGYLSAGSRALAVDVSEGLTEQNWARQMDATRARHRHDRDTGKGRPRTYYHFVLSPSLDDACDLETLRAFTVAWVRANFRNGRMRLEYAVVYHDDNAKGVPHAHIIVNVTDLATGKKLHLSNKDVVELQLSAQEIGERFGLTPLREKMQETVGARTEQPVYLTRQERELLSQGKLSWKWELREVVAETAPLSQDFEDFRARLEWKGYGVRRVEKRSGPYLVYAHRNGEEVRDSKLGAKFYLEALEKAFGREELLEDRAYTSWELMRISKGEVPWKEEIRRAIDAVAPVVMSLPELQEELGRLYGIRVIFNRRGITYQHSEGFKTRDESIGFRYTAEGLRQNAVLADPLPYPEFDGIAEESSKVAGVLRSPDTRQVAATLAYRDMVGLMERLGLASMDDVPGALQKARADLAREKAGLVSMRDELMRLNHLHRLETRRERDGAYLREMRDAADPAKYNETLLRYERTGLYLKEHGVADVGAARAELSAEYESGLRAYQERTSELSRDAAVYRNYLVARNVRNLAGGDSEGEGLSVQALFAASRVLSKHKIMNAYQLDIAISSRETRLDLLKSKEEEARKRKDELAAIRADVSAYREEKPYMPDAEILLRNPGSLELDARVLRFRQAEARLSGMGLEEAGFDAVEEEYGMAVRAHSAALKKANAMQEALDELKRARELCRSLEGLEGASAGRSVDQPKPSGKGPRDADPLPIGEAKRRRRERGDRLPSRSTKLERDFPAI